MFIRKYWLPLSVFLVAIAGVGLYLLATQPPPEPVKIYKVVEPEKPTEQPKAEAPVGDTSQDGHRHADGTWHEGAHETPPTAEVDTSQPMQVSDVSPAPLPRDYNRGAGNPPPFENVPVDLWDFEATKAAMIENVNFLKTNWDPKIYFDRDLGREMRIASAIASNIHNATYSLPIFLPEEAEELRTLYDAIYDIKGIERGRVSQLKREGHTLQEAIRIAGEETVERWGVKK